MGRSLRAADVRAGGLQPGAEVLPAACAGPCVLGAQCHLDHYGAPPAARLANPGVRICIYADYSERGRIECPNAKQRGFHGCKCCSLACFDGCKRCSLAELPPRVGPPCTMPTACGPCEILRLLCSFRIWWVRRLGEARSWAGWGCTLRVCWGTSCRALTTSAECASVQRSCGEDLPPPPFAAAWW